MRVLGGRGRCKGGCREEGQEEAEEAKAKAEGEKAATAEEAAAECQCATGADEGWRQSSGR
jgi:hypothetical protein